MKKNEKNDAKNEKNISDDDQLTITQRIILSYIKFRTKNNQPFTLTNKELAQAIDIKETSAKTMINKLIRSGYLVSLRGKHNLRNIILTGKPFKHVVMDAEDIDKKIISQANKEMEKELSYLRKTNQQYENKIEKLLDKITKLELEKETLKQQLKQKFK